MQNLIRKIVLVISLVLNLNLLISSKEQINQNQTIEIAALPASDHIPHTTSGSIILQPSTPTPPLSPTKPDGQHIEGSHASPHDGIDSPRPGTSIQNPSKQRRAAEQMPPKALPPHKRNQQNEPHSAPDSTSKTYRSYSHTPNIVTRKMLNAPTPQVNEVHSQESGGRDRSESYHTVEGVRNKKRSVENTGSPLVTYKKTLPIAGYKFPSRSASNAFPGELNDWLPSAANRSNRPMHSPQITYKKTIQPGERTFRPSIGSAQPFIRNSKKTLQQNEYTAEDEELMDACNANAPREVRKSSLLNNYTSVLAELNNHASALIEVNASARRGILNDFINSLPLLQHLENMIREAEEDALRLEDIEREEARPSAPQTRVNSGPNNQASAFRSARPSLVGAPRTLSHEKAKEIYTQCLNALIEGAVSNPLIYNVLSIDGGGIRGIVACIILEEIELRTGYRVQELFNVFTGTSIGGIIAIALLLRDSQGNFLYHPYELRQILDNNASKIFSRPWYARLSRTLKSKYENKNLKLLVTALINGRMTDRHTRKAIARAGIRTTFKPYSPARTSLSPSSSCSSDNDGCWPHHSTNQSTPGSAHGPEIRMGETECDILKKENVITTLLEVSTPPIISDSKISSKCTASTSRMRRGSIEDEEVKLEFGPDEAPSQHEHTPDTRRTRKESHFRTAQSRMRLIVPAYDIHGLNTVIFDSVGERNYSLIDVALSTSAAPTYFPSHPTHEVNKEDDTLNNVDGGLFSNFPAPAAISRLIGNNRLKPKLNVVSASTGCTPKASEDNLQKDRGRILWLVHGLFSIIRRSPTQFAEDTLTNCADTYIRFRVPLKQASSSMDESTEKNIKNLIHDTSTYCKSNESLFMDVKKKIVPLEIINARSVEPATYSMQDEGSQQHAGLISHMDSYSGLTNNSTTTLYTASTPGTEYYDDEEGDDELAELNSIIKHESSRHDSRSFSGSSRRSKTLPSSDETLDERESDYYDDEIQISPPTKPTYTK